MAESQASEPLEAASPSNGKLTDQGERCEHCKNTNNRFSSKDTRALAKRLNRVDTLLERLYDRLNIGGAFNAEDEDSGEDDVHLIPDHGPVKPKLVSESFFSRDVSREDNTPESSEQTDSVLLEELATAYRESVANICLELTQLGFNLYPLDEYEELPSVDVVKYIAQVRQVVVENYDVLEPVAKRIFRKGEFDTLSSCFNHSTSAIYYGTICCVLAKFFKPGPHWNDADLQLVVRWAVINCTRKCIRDSMGPPSIDRLRAIVMLFLSGSGLWIGGDTQNTLSRIAMSLCSDLGINRERVYMDTDSNQKGEWAAVFWMSYFINRSLSIRWGWVPSTEANDVSAVVVELAHSTQIFSIRPAIDLFRIYDSMYEFLSHSSAEATPVRQLVRKSLRYLKELEDWWKRMFPHVALSADPRMAMERSEQTFSEDRFTRAIMRMGISMFLYLKMSIYQSCSAADVTASIKDHIIAIYPSEVAALRQNSGVPSSGLQNRIASIMSPAVSLRKVSVQAIQICTANILLSYRDTCIKKMLDALNFSGAMLSAVLATRTCTQDELRAVKELSRAAKKMFEDSDMSLLRNLYGCIESHTQLIAELATAFTGVPSTRATETPGSMDSEGQPFDRWSDLGNVNLQSSYDDTCDLGYAAPATYSKPDMDVEDGLELRAFVDRDLEEFLL